MTSLKKVFCLSPTIKLLILFLSNLQFSASTSNNIGLEIEKSQFQIPITHEINVFNAESSSSLYSDINLLSTEPKTHQYENHTTLTKSRSKRFIYKNVYGTFDFGFLVIIPYIIILPPFSNLFNKWRAKRSLNWIDNYTHLDDDYHNNYYEDDPFVQKYLDRINSYFELLQISEPSCQQRAICEFSAEPTKYYPLSELFFTQLRAVPVEYFETIEKSKQNVSNVVEVPSLFKTYVEIQDYGLMHGHQECHTRFNEKCFYSTEQRLDTSVIKYWRVLESMLGLKIQDAI